MKSLDFFIIGAWLAVVVLLSEINHKEATKKLNSIEERLNKIERQCE